MAAPLLPGNNTFSKPALNSFESQALSSIADYVPMRDMRRVGAIAAVQLFPRTDASGEGLIPWLRSRHGQGFVPADPLGPRDLGERDQILRLSEIPVDQLDHFYSIVGDFDNFGLTNKALSKNLVGFLGSARSPAVIFSKPEHSLFWETRKALAELFSDQKSYLYRYAGGDEFAGSIEGDASHIKGSLQWAVQKFTQAFRSRYLIVRMDSVTLTREQIERLQNLPESITLVRHGHGYNLLLDRTGLIDAQAFVKSHIEPIVSSPVKILDYETANRGLFTISVGAVSARQVLDEILRQTGDAEDDWVYTKSDGRRYLAPQKVEILHRWILRASNDMLSHAKKQGRNQAFLVEGSIHSYLHTPITRENVDSEDMRFHRASPGIESLTVYYEPGTFRDVIGRQDVHEINLMTVDRYQSDGSRIRAFHHMQGNDYERGSLVIKHLALIAGRIFPSTNTRPVWIARVPPDSFMIASKEPQQVRGGTPFEQEMAEFTNAHPDLAPHLVFYKVSAEALHDNRLKNPEYFQNPYQALSMMSIAHWLLETMSALGPSNLHDEDLAKVTRTPHMTVIEFDPAKADKLIDAYLTAEDRIADEAYRSLKETPSPSNLIESDPLMIDDQEYDAPEKPEKIGAHFQELGMTFFKKAIAFVHDKFSRFPAIVARQKYSENIARKGA